MDKSLSEVHSSVRVAKTSTFLRRLFTFSGPAFMVSVGYMDPGNWATDIAGGSQYGYKLIWVILLANLMAILFQTLSARLGIVNGRDLAQACRDHYPRPINFLLWILCEIAIAACDLAEVLGSAIGLYLLFNIPLLWGVVITTLDVLLLMMLMSYGIRKMEAFILTLVATIGVCFALEMLLSKPALGEIATGFIPTSLDSGALYIALGIIGATVMPHNLYLHSALVQSRSVEKSKAGMKEANRFNFIDSVVALNGAFFVNAAILVLAATAFYKNGRSDVASIIDAHALLDPLLGSGVAPVAFGIALLAAGQSSTITGTFAGQIVMEGFIGLKMRPWLRRLITRLIAIVPAVIGISVAGERAIDSLLVLSQVILSLQLPFAMIPLLQFTSSRRKMGEFASGKLVTSLAWIAAGFIVLLNMKFVYDLISENLTKPGPGTVWVEFLLIPSLFVLLPLLLYLIAEPFVKQQQEKRRAARAFPGITAPANNLTDYRRVGIAIEGSPQRDQNLILGAIPFISGMRAEVYLIHCVQSVTGRFMGGEVADSSAVDAEQYLNEIAASLKQGGMVVHTVIGGGEPEDEIARISTEYNIELIIAGSHGHKFINDLLFGSTIDGMRHKVRLPVLAIPVKS